MKKLLVIVSTIFLMASVSAQQSPVKGLGFKLGDAVSAVKISLHTNLDPEPIESPIASIYTPTAGKTVLHLRSKGILVFFNRASVAVLIKIEQPYSNTIAGIKLGDTEKSVRAIMGKPIKTPWASGANKCFLYALDDTAYIRFDINETEGVQSILIQK